MRIAIIDGLNQDIGLNILFPEADYFINYIEYDSKTSSMTKYNIKPIYDWTKINDSNYDYLFIIIALYDAKPNTLFFKEDVYNTLQREIQIINNNNFKKVFIFDNYDYDYDPNEILNNEKVTLFFKRNYNKTKIYNKNVIPFPFIMFGYISIIEKLDNNNINNNTQLPRVFFTGTLFNHQDSQINYYRNREKLYNEISNLVYNPGSLNYDTFIEEISKSKLSLDLNGVGDPNKRTFEILSQGSLRISEYNDLKWPFDENFSEETIFKDAIEFANKVNILLQDEAIYNKCISNQYNIYNTYFNKKWIKEYIMSFI